MSTTADDFYVSSLTRLCEQHDVWAMGLIAQVLDSEGSAEELLSEARDFLAEVRATCVEQCGRAEGA